MAPGTPGQEAILPALTRTHMGRMQQRKCCVFFGDMSSRRAQSKPKSRTAVDLYIRRSFDLYWLQKFGGARRLLDPNGVARRYFPAGELISLGHDVRQVPPAYAKPFRQTHKNDFRDAYAIAETVRRSSTRCVPL